MYTSKIKTNYRNIRKSRLCQGDILEKLYFTIGWIKKDKIEAEEFGLTHAVIMSQDCDLEQDWKARNDLRALKLDKKKDLTDKEINLKSKLNDKFLRCILLCPAYRGSEFYNGAHIEKWLMRRFNKGDAVKLKANKEYNRYHYLPENSKPNLPELIIDFKHYFTVSYDYLYRSRSKLYKGTLSELFRENLSQRFSSYLSRIGLPELKK